MVAGSPVNVNKPAEVRAYVTAAMDDMEAVVLEESTKKSNLEAVLDWEIAADEPCGKCEGVANCPRCGGIGLLKPGKHPAAVRAKAVLNVKFATKEVELYEKLLVAGKFHASFVVIGALSSRMAGADGLNPQGIKHTKEVRRMFPLAWDGMVLCGGDFDSFEVTLADAVYNDPALRKALVTKGPCPKCLGTGRNKKTGGVCADCEGTGQAPQKIHALFGMALSGLSYEAVVASQGTDNDWYDKGKRGVFALIYGGDWNTLVQKLGVPADRAKAAYEKFCTDYPGVFKARTKTFNAFCSMKQPAGIGSAVVWEDPSDYAVTFLGFRRYFTLENKICKALFDLARNIPKHWKTVQGQGGAARSGADGRRCRRLGPLWRGLPDAGGQHAGGGKPRNPVAGCTDHQAGPAAAVGLAARGHCALAGGDPQRPRRTDDRGGPENRPEHHAGRSARRWSLSARQVPLIGMTWYEAMDNWAEKKGGAAPIKVRAAEMM